MTAPTTREAEAAAALERLRSNPAVTPPPPVPNGSQAPPPPAPAVERFDAEAFWTSRTVLERLRLFARARMCSPEAVLGVVMARVIAATPYTVTLPPFVGGRASLNLAVGLVGRSGAGKGAAEAAARDAFSLGSRVGSFDTHKLGSGQGLAHGYMHFEKEGLTRHAESCLFTMHEVDHFGGLTGQRGSTLLPELRSALMGEQLGHLYVDPVKRVEVPPHAYRLALTVGIQPARAGVLLDDSDGGTPQRFVWMSVTDPDAPDEPPDEPPPWIWEVPQRWPTDLDVCDTALQTIKENRLAVRRGQVEALDGHRLLLREKVAAALDIMDGRPGVSEEAWSLAGVVLQMSDAARATCQAVLSERAKEENLARGQSEGLRMAVAAEVATERAVKRVSQALVRKMSEPDAPDSYSHSDLRKTLASRDREHFDTAIGLLAAAGQVEVDEDGPGTRYRARSNSRGASA